MDLFAISVKTFRNEVKYMRYFVSVEQLQLKLSESGNPLQNFHVTDIPAFNNEDSL